MLKTRYLKIQMAISASVATLIATKIATILTQTTDQGIGNLSERGFKLWREQKPIQKIKLWKTAVNKFSNESYVFV